MAGPSSCPGRDRAPACREIRWASCCCSSHSSSSSSKSRSGSIMETATKRRHPRLPHALEKRGDDPMHTLQYAENTQLMLCCCCCCCCCCCVSPAAAAAAIAAAIWVFVAVNAASRLPERIAAREHPSPSPYDAAPAAATAAAVARR